MKSLVILRDVVYNQNFWTNWSLSTKFGLNDPRIRCKLPSRFVDFIEIDANLKEKLDEFEGAFEKNQVMKF